MLDLRSMSDEEFSVLVTPSVPQAAMYVRVEESGKILLSSKVAEKVAKTPVHIRFNKDYTAVQISKADMQKKYPVPEERKENCSGRSRDTQEEPHSTPGSISGLFLRGI